MSRIDRRSFLAGSAALIAAPALAQTPDLQDVDVAIVGAGAAGIAAARRLVAAKRSVAVFEASNRIGGRCAVDTSFFGVPFDLGAHWIHNPDANPLVTQAAQSKLDIYPAPRGQSLRIGARSARDAEMETYLAGLVRAQRAIHDVRALKADVAASRLLPNDLGDWRSTIEFILGTYALGKGLANASAFDVARAVPRESDAFCRQGYGALLAEHAAGLPIRLSTPVTMIYWGGKALIVETNKGDLRPRAVILTVSTNMLNEDKIEFIPPLPKRPLEAASRLSLGSLDHIVLDMPGNPLGLQQDDMVFERMHGGHSAALLANVSGTGLHMVEVGGDFGRDLSAQSGSAMIDFAGEWLSSLFGSSARRAIKRARATRWNQEPWVLGAMSTAAPGDAESRKVLMEPIGGDRVWFAGEAVHETQWGTVEGAWASGERTAERVLRAIGGARGESKASSRSKRSGHTGRRPRKPQRRTSEQRWPPQP
jgi:monoamine oxidase